MPRWLVLLLVAAPALLHGQQPDQRPVAFDVASVKPNTSGDARTTLGFETPHRFRAINETLRRLIGEAYGTPQALPPFRILEGPSWIDTDRFDVDARTERNPAPEDQHTMLRALLADRLKLVAHTERRELPAFALRLARKDGSIGPQLQRAEIDGEALRAAGTPSLFTAIEKQLGLKLESTMAPVDVLVIDRVEKPTPD